MRWIQIKDLLVNMDNIIAFLARSADFGVWGKPFIILRGLSNYHEEIICDSDEEALFYVNQIAMFVKPAVIEWRNK